MSKTIDHIDLDNSDLIPDNLLYEIFEVQYDDLFCKILKITEKSFAYFLQQQVIFNLLIIHKKVDPSILTAFQDLFFKRYKENVKTMKNNFEIIKNKIKNNDEDLIYLDITKCYIHCHKCSVIMHKCGSNLVLYDEHIYCTKCNNVYNKNQIMLFCPECKKNYYTKLRKPIFNNNKKFEKLFILKYKQYHCDSGKEEKIKCLKCSNNLYFRFIYNNPKIEDSINTIYCIKCKLKYNLKDVFFKCKICLKNFKCEARIFRDFPQKKKKLLFLIHTLLRNINALPNINLCDKQCLCDLKDIDEYKHNEDNGKLLEGIKNNQKKVVCNICMNTYEFKDIDWNCPKCGINFKYKNKNNNNNKSRSKSKSKKQNYRNYSNVGLINRYSDNELKKIPVIKANMSNMNNIYKKNFNLNEYILNSEQNINKYKMKRYDRSNNINCDPHIEKFKKIFINDKEINKHCNKHSFIFVKSKSKNDMIKNRIKNKKINSNNQQEQNLINNNINLIKDINNLNNENEDKDKDKENEKEKNEIKNEKDEKNDKNEKDEKKVDTASIFNKIKNNIYNLDEFYPDSKLKNHQKNPIRVSGRNISIYNDIFEEEMIKQIQPKMKNSNYLIKKEDYNDDIFNQYNYIDNNEGNQINENTKEIIQSRDYFSNNHLYIKSNKNIRFAPTIDNYENIPLEKKKTKKINYVNKIFFYKGQTDKDCRSYDENGNLNNNMKKFQTNNLYKKYIKYPQINNNIEINDNNYNINNSGYNYENENEFTNANYDNYDNYDNNYFNVQNYMENQQINLFNFNSENYSIIKVLGKGSNGKIYLVQDLQNQQTFALKSMIIDNEIELKQREEEYNLIYKITYENPDLKIINIYGLEVRKIDRYNMFLNVLMEKGECDWETEILNKKKIKNYYTEQELYIILTNLVGTFAFLQQKGISHRDVKPQNILCFANNEYKICDFGEAKYQKNKKSKKYGKNTDISNQTIRGTEMYMSPILFKAVQCKPDGLTKYNSFKSDVFSLGLCFLHASCLDSEILLKVRETMDMEKIGIIVNQYLGERYSQEFINLLLYMLQVDENYRPDFIELNSWILYGNY